MDNIAYLISDNARQLRRVFDERVRELGVTGPQARLLLILNRDGGQRQGFYADKLDVEPITLCRMVDRLEEAGLVERSRDPDDRRAWKLLLTRQATEKLVRLRGYVDDLVDEILVGISANERSDFMRMLKTVGENIAAGRDFKEAAHG